MVAPVEKLTSGDKGLDKNMWKALKSAQFKDIRFRAETFAIRAANAEGAQFGLAMQGALTVAGVTRRIVLDAQGFGVPGGLRIAGATSLRMTDYAVKPPVLMLGAIKTADQVVVKFDMELRRLPAERARLQRSDRDERERYGHRCIRSQPAARDDRAGRDSAGQDR